MNPIYSAITIFTKCLHYIKSVNDLTFDRAYNKRFNMIKISINLYLASKNNERFIRYFVIDK